VIDKLAERGEAWLHRWTAALGLAPADSSSSSTPEFLAGNLVLAFTATLVGAVAYFAAFPVAGFRRHLRDDILRSLEYSSKLFVAYALLFFLALLTTSALSFVVYRRFTRQWSFVAHWTTFVNLTALEPCAGLAIGLFFAAAGQGCLSSAAIAILAIARLAQAAIAYRGLASATQTRRRRIAAYSFGFLPPFLAFCSLFVAVSWLLIASAIVPWWD
jgi:hypothetical protein